MIATKDWLKASWDAGKDMLTPLSGRSSGEAHARHSVMVPIRALGPSYRERITQHLLQLEPPDRYCALATPPPTSRFAATPSSSILIATKSSASNRRLELIAMAHLAFAENADHKQCAEFGVSVLKKARGGDLVRGCLNGPSCARNEGVNMVFIHALTENTAMLKIARNAGATVQRDGSESEAYLALPPADLDSRMAQIVEQQYAELDYRLKRQAKQFWDFLAGVQEVRQGVRKARHQSAE